MKWWWYLVVAFVLSACTTSRVGPVDCERSLVPINVSAEKSSRDAKAALPIAPEASHEH